MELVAEHRPTVVLSSHLLADVERVCDHLVILAEGHVRLAGDIDELLHDHQRLTGPRDHLLPAGTRVVHSSSTDRQTTVVVRGAQPSIDPRWAASPVGLEELVLAYLAPADPPVDAPRLAAVPS
jgi:ABC-2 type transport system ATP-binding protein